MKVITIGRNSKNNDITINDPLVSQHHLQIIVDDSDNVYVADMGSENGTYVNEHRISGQTPLRSDDKLRIGNTTLPWHSYIGIAEPTIDEPVSGDDDDDNADGQNKKKKWITVAAAVLLLAAIVAIALLAHSNIQKKAEIEKMKTTIDSLNSKNNMRSRKYADEKYMSDSLRLIQRESERNIAQENNSNKNTGPNKYSSKSETSNVPLHQKNSFSEEAQLDKEFEELYRQLNTKENAKWRNNVFNSVLDKGTKREMAVLKNLWQNYTIEQKKEMITEINRVKPKK